MRLPPIMPTATAADDGRAASRTHAVQRAGNQAAIACLEWLAQCSARIVALDPALDIDAADRIAGYLWSNERLRHMPPEQAAEFVFAHPEARASMPAGFATSEPR